MEHGITASGPQGLYVLRIPLGVMLTQEEMAKMAHTFHAALERGSMVVEYGITVEWVGPGPKPRPSMWQRLRARLER